MIAIIMILNLVIILQSLLLFVLKEQRDEIRKRYLELLSGWEIKK